MRRILTADNLIGDLLFQTPAIRQLKLSYPDDAVIYHVPQKDKGVHVSGTHVLFRDNPYLDGVFVGDAFTPAEDDTILTMDCMRAYLWACANKKTIPHGFAQQVGVELDNIRYDYFVDPVEVDAQLGLMHDLSEGRPIVIVARHSASCSSNDPKVVLPNKCVPNFIWVEVANWLLKAGYMPVAVGSAKEERDVRYRHWPGKKLYGRPIRDVAAIISKVDAVLAIDTGIRHLAAAVGTNMYCISGTIPISQIRCEPVQPEQKIFEALCPIVDVTAQLIIDGAKRVL